MQPLDYDKECRLIGRVIALDNEIGDVIRSYMTCLHSFEISIPEFLDYYKVHGLHRDFNLEMVLKY